MCLDCLLKSKRLHKERLQKRWNKIAAFCDDQNALVFAKRGHAQAIMDGKVMCMVLNGLRKWGWNLRHSDADDQHSLYLAGKGYASVSVGLEYMCIVLNGVRKWKEELMPICKDDELKS